MFLEKLYAHIWSHSACCLLSVMSHQYPTIVNDQSWIDCMDIFNSTNQQKKSESSHIVGVRLSQSTISEPCNKSLIYTSAHIVLF